MCGCVALCCSVLQCVAVCCSVLQYDITILLERRDLHCNVVQCVAMCCTVLHSVAMSRVTMCLVEMTLQCGLLCCTVLHCVALCCMVVPCRMARCVSLNCHYSMVHCVEVCCIQYTSIYCMPNTYTHIYTIMKTCTQGLNMECLASLCTCIFVYKHHQADTYVMGVCM